VGPNHWWLLDYWTPFPPATSFAWNYYGSFTAVSNTITGLSTVNNDDVLILPLNLAYGTSSNFQWFQFDIDFSGKDHGTWPANGWYGNIGWWIWNIDASTTLCAGTIPTANFHANPIGLPYTVGHAYHYTGTIVSGNFRFQMWDDTAGTNWYQDFPVPSTSEVMNWNCFSPASGVEGYTTPTAVGNVPTYGFTIGYGMTSFTFLNPGSGMPTGIGIYESSLGGSPTTWHWEMNNGGTIIIPSVVTFYTDPTSGTITATTAFGTDVMANGATGNYLPGFPVHVVANPPSGYSFSYWETKDGVSVDNQLSKDTHMATPFDGSPKAHFVKPGHRADLIISSTDAYHGRTFWVKTSASGYSSWFSSKWGTDTDGALVGDIDGDGKGDFIVYSPSNTQGVWWVKTSSSGYKSWFTVNWGKYPDIGMVADVDGDGKADFVIWTAYPGIWWVKTSSSGYSSWFRIDNWGNQLDYPFLAQMDND
jgi:hypothetical protein